MAVAQILFDLSEKLAEIMLIRTLAKEPNCLPEQRRDRTEHSLRHPLVSECYQIRLIGQLPGLLLAGCADEGGFIYIDQVSLGC